MRNKAQPTAAFSHTAAWFAVKLVPLPRKSLCTVSKAVMDVYVVLFIYS